MIKSGITTAVFPVAGLGTRFLPVTKTGPKEMLPIVDKPIIQYAVQEAVDAGIKHLVFVTSSEKRAIEDYFDRNLPLEMWLERQGKTDALATVRGILPGDIQISYVRQPMPLGLGHAIACAQHVIGERPFAVLLPDDVIHCPAGNCLHDMLDLYQQHQTSVIAVEQVPLAEVSKYGIVALRNNAMPWQIDTMIEKPSQAQAPSRLAVIGRYVLSPRIFEFLNTVARGKGGEIQLTDALVALLAHESILAYPLNGHRYDCGDKIGMIKATLTYALQRPEMRRTLLAYLAEKLAEEQAQSVECVV